MKMTFSKFKLSTDQRNLLGLCFSKALFWSLKLSCIKLAMNFASLSSIVFGVLLAENLALHIKSSKGIQYRPRQWNIKPLDLIVSFLVLALFYSLVSTVHFLCVSTSYSLFYSFPLFIPLFLRYWMGRRITKTHKLLFFSFLLVLLFYFRSHNHFEYLTLIVGIASILLRAFQWVVRKRFYPTNQSRSFLKEPYLLALVFSLPLLFIDPAPIHMRWILPLLGYMFTCLLEGKALKAKNTRRFALEYYPIIYGLGLLCSLFFDFFIFKNPPLSIYLSASCINSFFIFLVFYQKKILPNLSYDL